MRYRNLTCDEQSEPKVTTMMAVVGCRANEWIKDRVHLFSGYGRALVMHRDVDAVRPPHYRYSNSGRWRTVLHRICHQV